MESVLERLEASGLRPDAVTFNSILGAYGRMGLCQLAEETLGRMRREGVTPDAISYNTLILAFWLAENPKALKPSMYRSLKFENGYDHATPPS